MKKGDIITVHSKYASHSIKEEMGLIVDEKSSDFVILWEDGEITQSRKSYYQTYHKVIVEYISKIQRTVL